MWNRGKVAGKLHVRMNSASYPIQPSYFPQNGMRQAHLQMLSLRFEIPVSCSQTYSKPYLLSARGETKLKLLHGGGVNWHSRFIYKNMHYIWYAHKKRALIWSDKRLHYSIHLKNYRLTTKWIPRSYMKYSKNKQIKLVLEISNFSYPWQVSWV